MFTACVNPEQAAGKGKSGLSSSHGVVFKGRMFSLVIPPLCHFPLSGWPGLWPVGQSAMLQILLNGVRISPRRSSWASLFTDRVKRKLGLKDKLRTIDLCRNPSFFSTNPKVFFRERWKSFSIMEPDPDQIQGRLSLFVRRHSDFMFSTLFFAHTKRTAEFIQ